MFKTVQNPSRDFVVLSVILGVALALCGQVAVAASGVYKTPDPKIIAKAESITAALKAAPCKKKRRVLVYGISFGAHRTTIPTAREVFTLLGKNTGAFEAVVSEDLANFEAHTLKQFDAVIFANTTGDVFCRPADKAQFNALSKDKKLEQLKNCTRLAKNLDDYVRAGGGFMAIHAATDTLKKWSEYTDMIGAVFWQHPWGPKETVTIRVEDPGHALTRGVFEKTEFTFKDEIYEFREPYDRQELHVLLSLDMAKSDKPNRPVRRTDGDYPVAWTRSHGKGRVFYCSLGHAASTFCDPTILKFWLRGIQYATGDINAATPPNPKQLIQDRASASIEYDAGMPQLVFAAQELASALKEARQEDLKVTLKVKPDESSPEAFQIRRIGSAELEVTGSDAIGAMYGGLEVADLLRLGVPIENKALKPSAPGPYKLGIDASKRLVIYGEVDGKRITVWKSN